MSLSLFINLRKPKLENSFNSRALKRKCILSASLFGRSDVEISQWEQRERHRNDIQRHRNWCHQCSENHWWKRRSNFKCNREKIQAAYIGNQWVHGIPSGAAVRVLAHSQNSGPQHRRLQLPGRLRRNDIVSTARKTRIPYSSSTWNVDSLLTVGAFVFLGFFLWILTIFKIIEIRLSDVSSFFGGDFTLGMTMHAKRRQFRWDEEAKGGEEPREVIP